MALEGAMPHKRSLACKLWRFARAVQHKYHQAADWRTTADQQRQRAIDSRLPAIQRGMELKYDLELAGHGHHVLGLALRSAQPQIDVEDYRNKRATKRRRDSDSHRKFGCHANQKEQVIAAPALTAVPLPRSEEKLGASYPLELTETASGAEEMQCTTDAGSAEGLGKQPDGHIVAARMDSAIEDLEDLALMTSETRAWQAAEPAYARHWQTAWIRHWPRSHWLSATR